MQLTSYEHPNIVKVALLSKEYNRIITQNISQLISNYSKKPTLLRKDHSLDQHFETEIVETSQITIHIKKMKGNMISITVNTNIKILDIKNIIWAKLNILPGQQRILFNGKHMEDDKTLQYYNIKEDNIVYLILRLRGGMFHPSTDMNANEGYETLLSIQKDNNIVNQIIKLDQTYTCQEIVCLIAETIVTNNIPNPELFTITIQTNQEEHILTWKPDDKLDDVLSKYNITNATIKNFVFKVTSSS